jgi:hypothetical protein
MISQPDHIPIQNGSWDAVRLAINRINDRLDHIEQQINDLYVKLGIK